MSMRISMAVGACLALAAALTALRARGRRLFTSAAKAAGASSKSRPIARRGFLAARALRLQELAAGARAGYEWGPWRFA